MPPSHKTRIQVPTPSFNRVLQVKQVAQLLYVVMFKVVSVRVSVGKQKEHSKSKTELGLMKEIHQGMMKHPVTSNSRNPISTLGHGENPKRESCSCKMDRGCSVRTATANQEHRKEGAGCRIPKTHSLSALGYPASIPTG